MKTFVITTGDIIGLGEHRLACGDSRDAALVGKLLGEDHASLILTDVPYGVAFVEGKAGFSKSKIKHAPIENDHLQSDAEFATFTQAWLEAVRPHLTRKNASYIFCSDKMLFALREGMLKAGWKMAQMLFWLKTASVIGRLDYAPQHECIAYGWHGVHEFMKSKDHSVLIHPKPSRSTLHPTMKPVGLLRRLILNSSRIDDLVYDPFGGSGSTLIACEDTKRRCAMIELDPDYCQVIADRFEKRTGKKAVLLSPSNHER